MKKTLLILFVILLTKLSFAQQVSRNDVQDLATEMQSWLHPNLDVTVRQIYDYSENGHTLMYEVLMSNDEIILLSGNYKCKPILATAKNSGISILNHRDSMSCGFAFLLDWYEEQIKRAFDDAGNNATKQEWKNKATRPSRTSSVEPLTKSDWRQHDPYNRQIPSHGNCEHALVGCVGVAVGQLLYYYKHPVLIENHVWQFDWCNMKNRISAYSPTIVTNAVATLLADCAEKVNSNYGCTGTTSFLTNAHTALVENYKFNSDSYFEFQRNHSDEWWMEEIKRQLDNGHPVPYAGATNFFGRDGHAFICDGYNESDKFHFNFGIDGVPDDLYCELTYIYDIAPDTPYNHWLCAIFDAYPVDYFDLCDDTLFLQDFYFPFYDISSHSDIRPYHAVPSTVGTLASASSTSGYTWRTIPTGASAQYKAHTEILLRDGFSVERGAEFTAQIVPCANCESNRGIEDEYIEETRNEQEEPVPDMAVGRPSVTTEGLRAETVLYPNPTDGDLTINVDGEVQSIVIYNAMGRPVGGWKLHAITPDHVTLDINPLATGTYLLLITTSTGSRTAKFIKQ